MGKIKVKWAYKTFYRGFLLFFAIVLGGVAQAQTWQAEVEFVYFTASSAQGAGDRAAPVTTVRSTSCSDRGFTRPVQEPVGCRLEFSAGAEASADSAGSTSGAAQASVPGTDRSCRVSPPLADGVSACSLGRTSAHSQMQTIQLSTQLIKNCVENSVNVDGVTPAFSRGLMHFTRSDSPLQMGLGMRCPLSEGGGASERDRDEPPIERSTVEVCYRLPASDTYGGLDHIGIRMSCEVASPEGHAAAKTNAREGRSPTNAQGRARSLASKKRVK